MKYVQIVALSSNGVIGNKNGIPWNIPSDLQHFKKHTMNQVCIVGRNTYEGIKHLKGRIFVVVTSTPSTLDAGIIGVTNIKDAIEESTKYAIENNLGKVMIIGGSQIYKQSMQYTTHIIATHIEKGFDGDSFYEIPEDFEILQSYPLSSCNSLNYMIVEYKKGA